MRTRALGMGEESIPVLGQGTWELELGEPSQVVRALHTGLELGMTHVDTAEMYGDGRVEELLGRALVGRRDEVFLASKVLPHNASRTGTRRACERSLRRLGVERLDLYLLHWPGEHPLADTLLTLEELRSEGKIRHYGVSNFDAPQLAEAVSLAGPGRIVCNQVLYHPEQRAVEHAVLPACRRLGVTLVAYSPLGSGRFPATASRAGHALAEVAGRHSATPRQVALAFVLRLEGVVAIPKSARAEHVRENAGAAALRLEPVDVARLEAALPLGREPRELPTL